MLLAFVLWAEQEVVAVAVVVDSYHYRKFLIHLDKFYNPVDTDLVVVEVPTLHSTEYQL